MTRILVVDDESRVLKSLQALLVESGYCVVAARDGDAAISIDEAELPDLVILDLMLPGTSGLEICRVLKKRRPVPIIMLTGRDGLQDKVLGLETGADDYVTKPFFARELLARIEALLRRSQMGADSGAGAKVGPLTAGKLRVDLFSRLASYDGRHVPLKTKEFDLLAFLMSYRGTVFSRQELLMKVWGYSAEDLTGTVAVHIRGLRKKLGKDRDLPEWIETVRGEGYRFRA